MTSENVVVVDGSGLKNLFKDSSPLGHGTKYATTSNVGYYENMRYEITLMVLFAVVPGGFPTDVALRIHGQPPSIHGLHVHEKQVSARTHARMHV